VWLIWCSVFTADGTQSVIEVPERIGMCGPGTRVEAREDPGERGTPKPGVLQYCTP